jgi:hypothetical protein
MLESAMVSELTIGTVRQANACWLRARGFLLPIATPDEFHEFSDHPSFAIHVIA